MSHQFPREQVQASMSTADNAHAVGWVSDIPQKVKSGTVLHEVTIRNRLGISECCWLSAPCPNQRPYLLKDSSTWENHRFIAHTLKKGQS